jgi:predicted HTH domain antitoxin
LVAYDEARRAPCKNPNLVDAEAACELLGVNPGDLEDMVRRRIVCPFDRGQAAANGLLFRSEMLVRLRNSAREWKLDLRDLREYVNADEAAELMGVSVDHFRKRYVNTGRVSFRLRDIGYREGLFSRKEVQALAEEVALFASRVVGINEAKEILGLGATTVHTLVDGGHLKPVVGPSVDGFGRVKFLREDVERLARQRTGQMSLLGV